MISSFTIMAGAIIIFAIAYTLYGRFLQKSIGVDSSKPTPAHTLFDDVDYVPARGPVLFGHHFTAIAGAASIIGPIAGAAYGWLPVLIWIVAGGIFIGGVHDFTSLMASVRHRGGSVGEIIEEEIGRRGKLLFLFFSWAAIILVLAVFTFIVAQTFTQVPAAATSAVIIMIISIVFGILLYRYNVPLPVLTTGTILLTALSVWAGTVIPLQLPIRTWIVILVIYESIASVAPVWILQQPKGYISSYIVYTVIAMAVGGIFYVNPQIRMPAYTSFSVEGTGPLFPLLFVTVACGAISGFHSLVTSGTTAKQLDNEVEARPIGYGAMLLESVLAVAALLSAAILYRDQYSAVLCTAGGGNPVNVFATSIAALTTRFGIGFETGKNFVSLAVATLALTTLETASRLGRFAFQEFFHRPSLAENRQIFLNKNRYVATLCTTVMAVLLIFSGQGMSIWPVFGASNQLLAALALLTVSAWLSRKKKAAWYVKIPLVLMFTVAMSALALMMYREFARGRIVPGSVALVLFVFALFLVAETTRVIGKSGIKKS